MVILLLQFESESCTSKIVTGVFAAYMQSKRQLMTCPRNYSQRVWEALLEERARETWDCLRYIPSQPSFICTQKLTVHDAYSFIFIFIFLDDIIYSFNSPAVLLFSINLSSLSHTPFPPLIPPLCICFESQ